MAAHKKPKASSKTVLKSRKGVTARRGARRVSRRR